MNIEKEKAAIERLKAFVPKNGDPYFVCYSGGKDSDCIRILASLAGVPFELHHNLTTVDAPETISYVKSIPGIIIDKARYANGKPKTMWNLIVRKKMPPLRYARWCCSELKEVGGKGRLKVTGVRWAESVARSKRSGLVQISGKSKSTQKYLEENGISHSINKFGGVVLNHDNSESRRAVEHCYRTTSTLINPIIDWSDYEVWDFLRYYGCFGNPLYYCGQSRIGCVGCPLSGFRRMKLDFMQYPKYKKLYISAFQKMVDERNRLGLFNNGVWGDGLSVFKWWTGDNPEQLTMFSDSELEEIYNDMGVV